MMRCALRVQSPPPSERQRRPRVPVPYSGRLASHHFLNGFFMGSPKEAKHPHVQPSFTFLKKFCW